MRKIKGFDKVLLKAGREADVMETFANKVFIVYVGDSLQDWETISVIIDYIEKNRCKRIIGFDECFFYQQNATITLLFNLLNDKIKYIE